LTSNRIDYTTYNMMSLKEFLSRPVKVQTLSWVPGTSINATISLSTYLGLLPIKQKLNQFARARFTQVITVSYTANPFFSGGLLLSALPLGSFDTIEPARLPLTPVAADFVRLTQRPHVFMSVNKTDTFTLKLPYFNTTNWISLNQSEVALVSNPYTIAINSVNNLAHCNGATDPLTVNIFFSLEDLDLELPTTYYASSSEDKKISSTLEKLSHVTHKAGKIAPVITPYTTPLEMALRLGADAAKACGYSRPFSTRDPIIRTHNSLSAPDQPNTIPKMALSSANSIALGAELNVPPDVLDMDIKSLAKRYSLLNSTQWAVSAAADTTLLQSGVTPVVYIANGSERHYPAISYLSAPFSYWSGTIKYKFQAIASNMHRGRLRITWDPYPTTDINTPAFYSTPATIILDLEKDQEVELEVPYHSIYNVLQTNPLPFPIALGANSSICNGYFTVSVLNALNTPNTTVLTPVFLNVWIAAGDDYAVYRPGSNTKNMCYLASSGSVGTKSSVKTPFLSIGEDVSDIRVLVKREQPNYAYSTTSNLNAMHVRLYEFDRPAFRGTKAAGSSRTTTIGVGAIPFDYACNGFLTHYEMCFAARRGGYINRYTVVSATNDRVPISLVDHNFLDTTSTRSLPALVADGTTFVPANFAAWGSYTTERYFTGFQALEIDSLTNTNAGRKPYYSIYTMLPNRRGVTAWGSASALSGPAHFMSSFCFNDTTATYMRYVAADEDYHLLFYIGPPIIYEVASPDYLS